MTFVTTQAALETPRQITTPEYRSSSFADLTFPQHAPWLYSALEQLWNLEWSGKNIEGLGDLSVPANTAIRVRRLLFKIGNTRALPAPRVAVISGGGISLNWMVGSREVKYFFWPEGVFTYEKESGGEIIHENELPADDAFDPKEPMEWLLNT